MKYSILDDTTIFSLKRSILLYILLGLLFIVFIIYFPKIFKYDKANTLSLIEEGETLPKKIPLIPEEWINDHEKNIANTISQDINHIIQKGDTLYSILMKNGVDKWEIEELKNSIEKVYPPNKMKIGNNLKILLNPKNKIKGMIYQISSTEYLKVETMEEGFISEKINASSMDEAKKRLKIMK